jgi:hypothetical protein
MAQEKSANDLAEQNSILLQKSENDAYLWYFFLNNEKLQLANYSLNEIVKFAHVFT